MALLDFMNWVGRRRWLRPIGLVIHKFAIQLEFATMVKMAGRRMVCAPAGAPAIILTQASIYDALNNAEVLFKAIQFTVDRMGFDTVNMIVDMSLEAEACGCQVEYHEHGLPDVISHPVKSLADIAKLRIPDPYRDGRLPVFVESMRLIEKNYTMLRVGIVIGPFTLAMLLAGSDIYVDIRKDPKKVKALLDYCRKVIQTYGLALIKSGADILMIAEPMGSQLSPAQYNEFCHPFVKDIINTFRKPCGLHICGKTGHIIHKMAESGSVLLSVDEIDIFAAAKTVPEQVVMMGNISPTLIKIKSPDEIKNLTKVLVDGMRFRKKFIIGPGCDLAPETSLENILALVKTVKG